MHTMINVHTYSNTDTHVRAHTHAHAHTRVHADKHNIHKIVDSQSAFNLLLSSSAWLRADWEI